MKIYDISVELYNKMLKWPSDPEIKFEAFSSIKNGGKANVTNIKCGSHSGTHIDAPYHFILKGKGIDKIKLDSLIGDAWVREIHSDKIKLSDIQNVDYKKYKRILFKTKNSRLLKNNKFYPNYVYLDYPAAEFLVKQKIKLVGIDYLSIERYKSKDHKVHQILLKNNVVIIETLDLSKVKEGEYFLLALPIKIRGGDGAPARVVLIKK